MDRLRDCLREIPRPQRIRGEIRDHDPGHRDPAQPPSPGREQHDSQHGELWFHQRGQHHHDRDQAPALPAQRHQKTSAIGTTNPTELPRSIAIHAGMAAMPHAMNTTTRSRPAHREPPTPRE